MEFIALIIAIIAIVLALKARSRIALLERNMELIGKGLEGGAAPVVQPFAAPSARRQSLALRRLRPPFSQSCVEVRKVLQQVCQ